jgi:hypothetical protein
VKAVRGSELGHSVLQACLSAVLYLNGILNRIFQSQFNQQMQMWLQQASSDESINHRRNTVTVAQVAR